MFGLVAAMLCIGFGCGPAPTTSRTLTLAVPSAPLTLDPRGAFNAETAHVQQLIFNTLVTKGADFSFAPELATGWEVSADSTVFVFTLRPDVLFHTGQRLTAADVAYTFNSMKGAHLGKSAAFHALDHVEALADDTVRFVCSRPNPGLLVDLVAVGIIPDGSGERAATHPVGTGPFRLIDDYPGEGDLKLQAFDRYFGGRPSADSLAVRIIPDGAVLSASIEAREVDLAVNPPLAPEALSRLGADGASSRVTTRPGGGVQFVVLNTERPRLDDARVRRALGSALDRAAILDALLGGRGRLTDSPLPPGHWAYSAMPAPGTRDDDASPGPPPPLPARIALLIQSSQFDRDLASVIQDSWNRLGVDTTIVAVDPAAFFERLRYGDFDAAIHRLTGGNQFTTIFKGGFHSRSIHTRGGQAGELNYARFRDPELDDLIERADLEASRDRRIALYAQIQARLRMQMPWILLWTPDNTAVFGPRVREIDLSPGGDYYCLRVGSILADDPADLTPAQ